MDKDFHIEESFGERLLTDKLERFLENDFYCYLPVLDKDLLTYPAYIYVQSSSMLHEMQLVSGAILRDSSVNQILNAQEANTLNSLDICDIIRDALAPYCIFHIQNEDGTPAGSLIVTLRMSEFLRIFHSLDVELCALFNQDVYISSYISNINIEGFDWRSEASVSALVGKAVTCKYIEGDGYTYMVAVPRENYSRSLYVIIKWALIYAAAALVLGYLYLYQIAKRRYQRISAMAAQLPNSYEGDQSLEHIYDNIRKSLEEYKIQKEHFQLGERERTLHSLLAASGSQDATSERFEAAGVEPGRGPYYVAAFFSSEGAVPEPGRDRETVFMSILFRSTIRELAERVHISFSVCGIPRINAAILYGGDGASLPDVIPSLCADAIEVLAHSYSADIRVTVSSPVDSVLELPAAYRETQRLRSFAKSIDSDAVMACQEELQRDSSILLNGDFIRPQQMLISTILIRKYDAISSMVESILTDHVSFLRKSYALVQGRLLLPLTQQVYGRMAQRTQEYGKLSGAAGQACDYIAHNLGDQNLNVTAISEAAGISVQRLTRMFQAQFGVSIAEYVNAQRIKLAKELLPDRRLTVAQIAQQVGYYNADTFTRNFRKLEGVTPTEYRKALFKG